MGRVFVHLAHRHLVRAPVILGALAIDFFRARPALGCAKHDHRPAGPLRETILTCVAFDALNFTDDGVEGVGHQLVHRFAAHAPRRNTACSHSRGTDDPAPHG